VHRLVSTITCILQYIFHCRSFLPFPQSFYVQKILNTILYRHVGGLQRRRLKTAEDAVRTQHAGHVSSNTNRTRVIQKGQQFRPRPDHLDVMYNPSGPEHVADSRGPRLVIVSSIMICIMISAVGGRLLVRKLKRLPLHLDDLLIISAMVLASALCLISIAAVQLVGLGKHIEAALVVNREALAAVERLNFVDHVLAYSGVIILAKLSVLVFYNRVFKEPWVQQASYVVAGINIGLGVAVLISPLVICRPINWPLNGHGNDGRCLDWQRYLTYISIPNITTDMILLLMPMPSVWRLTMSFWQKMGLTFAFTLGGSNIVASCIRLFVFCRWSNHFTDDTTWNAVEPAIWVMVESGTLVVTACIPHLRPLVSKLVPKTSPREQTRQATTITAGPFRPFKKRARRLGSGNYYARSWWMLSFKQEGDNVIAKAWGAWDRPGDIYHSQRSSEGKTGRWIKDLEYEITKEHPWPPAEAIVMTQEIVVTVSESGEQSCEKNA
jgi:hypothetical protein